MATARPVAPSPTAAATPPLMPHLAGAVAPHAGALPLRHQIEEAREEVGAHGTNAVGGHACGHGHEGGRRRAGWAAGDGWVLRLRAGWLRAADPAAAGSWLLGGKQQHGAP